MLVRRAAKPGCSSDCTAHRRASRSCGDNAIDQLCARQLASTEGASRQPLRTYIPGLSVFGGIGSCSDPRSGRLTEARSARPAAVEGAYLACEANNPGFSTFPPCLHGVRLLLSWFSSELIRSVGSAGFACFKYRLPRACHAHDASVGACSYVKRQITVPKPCIQLKIETHEGPYKLSWFRKRQLAARRTA